MKRLLLALLGGLCLHAPALAQMGATTQRGKATQELEEKGYVAAHNRFPFDSKVRLINPDNGREAEVIIVDRIPLSPDRIIDLSSDVWDDLELTRDTMVTLIYNPYSLPVQNTPEPEEEPFIEPEPPPPLITAQAPAQRLYHLLVLDRIHSALNADIVISDNIDILYQFNHGANGYIVALYISSGEPAYPEMPDKSNILADLITEHEAILRDYIDSRAFRRHVTHRKTIAEMKTILSGLVQAPSGMKIVPAIPRADSGKIYRLQIGAFTEAEIAAETVQHLKDSGFDAVQEIYGSWYRVLAAGIRAADIGAALRALYAAGFTEVWIRE